MHQYIVQKETHRLCQWDAQNIRCTCNIDTDTIGLSDSRSHHGSRLGRLQGRPWRRHITLPELPQHWIDLLKCLIDLLLELGACCVMKLRSDTYLKRSSGSITSTYVHRHSTTCGTGIDLILAFTVRPSFHKQLVIAC